MLDLFEPFYILYSIFFIDPVASSKFEKVFDNKGNWSNLGWLKKNLRSKSGLKN